MNVLYKNTFLSHCPPQDVLYLTVQDIEHGPVKILYFRIEVLD